LTRDFAARNEIPIAGASSPCNAPSLAGYYGCYRSDPPRRCRFRNLWGLSSFLELLALLRLRTEGSYSTRVVA
jgi:hypothetical protein